MQKSSVLSITRVALLSVTAFTAFAAGQPAIAADSACKGLAQTECEGNAQCRWQPALTRKDGVQVNAHCRKGTKKNVPADTTATTPAPETTPTSVPATAPISAPAPALTTTAPPVAAPVPTSAVPATEKKIAP